MDNKFQLLMVEDNAGDAELAQIVFDDAKLPCQVTICEDGEQALMYLQRWAPYSDAARPDVIMLDLNLPKLSGHEVLRVIKNDNRLKSIPVIVVTTSASDSALLEASQYPDTLCFTKPFEFKEYERIVNALKSMVKPKS